MAGHSKWANIQHRKGAQDAKRGKLFTKIIREITVAAKNGGEVENNPRLRAAIDKALSNNMTRDTIDRAVKRGAGGDNDVIMEDFRYDGYAPGGVAVLVTAMSDNKNRTVAEVRHAFSKNGGSLGADGSVAYLFKQQGTISFAPGVNEDKVMEIALEAGADDIVTHEDKSIDVITTFETFGPVRDALEKAGLKTPHAEVSMEAQVKIEVDDVEIARKINALIDRLEDLDDVQEVFSNVEFSETVMVQLNQE